MAEEMIAENLPWESDEAADWESDEAFGESDESAEDIGERARRRPVRRVSRFRPGRGVRGIVVKGPDGRARNVPFPQKLATAEETNKGLASQEVGRRALEEKLERLEKRFRGQQKTDGSISGLVTLGIGGGLTVFGAIQASRLATGSTLRNWAGQTSTQIAAVTSAGQLATSGARLLMSGYHWSRIGIAADIFSAAQLALFAFASLSTERDFERVPDKAGAAARMAGGAPVGSRFIDADGQGYQIELVGGAPILRLVS